jgi:hypothetical protein
MSKDLNINNICSLVQISQISNHQSSIVSSSIMSLHRIDHRSSALMLSTQEIANFSDAVMAVLLHAIENNATDIHCNIASDLSIDCTDNGHGFPLDALTTFADQCDTPNASFSTMRVSPLVHVIAASQSVDALDFFPLNFFCFRTVPQKSFHARSKAALSS